MITDLTRTQLITAAHKIWSPAFLWVDVQTREIKLNTYTLTYHSQEYGYLRATYER